MKKRKNKSLVVASSMPPLRHNNGPSFNIKQSDVVKWLIDQPEILKRVFTYYSDHAMVFNKETGLWKGINTK